jgi:putative heme-binding domain-containing protein
MRNQHVVVGVTPGGPGLSGPARRTLDWHGQTLANTRSTLGNQRSIGFFFVLLAAAAGLGEAGEPRPLFDGSSLAGWDVRAGEETWWRVADGMIVGGSLEHNVPHNTFLATQESFADFELVFQIRLRGAGGFVNSGVQIRSERVPDSHEMKGYQVDVGPGWWGKLYDESRRNKVIGEPQDPAAVAAAVKEDGWNEYRIRAEGPAIRSWINGVAALAYVEQDAAIPLAGRIGIQVHGGGKALVEVKDIRIESLPATALPPAPAAPAAPADGLKPGNAEGSVPLSAAAEAAQFTLPAGFRAELVLQESTDPANRYGKFVALAFDAHGRLWTTTAFEYPVDANESPEVSRRLFAAGGRDKVIVVDDPWAAQPAAPRVFAEGLAIPLGVLPYRDGAFVQYGPEIRFYRDTDGDGRADGHEAVLEGFGVQDSHLFPHQFTRVPGDWILLAQGLFNQSTVKRPGGEVFADGSREVRFDACKLGRFRPDGSLFEPLTAGPNNIWGLTISRAGETWLQEANDIGFPIFPYEPGVLVSTGSADRLRPYQPLMPAPLGPPQMGGSGLSGLALADDADGWPGPWGASPGGTPGERVFYVANPITNQIQSIIATRAGERYTYRKGPDLLTSADPAFRPVAIQFGPDGCLYVVDWYNKIISHNEVPRNHPDRDRERGRIWRIRHASQPVREPVAVAKLSTESLPDHLGAANTRIADFAWQEIVDRRATSLVQPLERRAADPAAPVAARVGSLWALEGLAAVPVSLLESLVADPSPDLRHEAIRIAASTCSEEEFRRLAEPLVRDPSPRVRAALGDAIRRIPVTEPDTIALLMRFGGGSVDGDQWAVYDREFERYLARWALEKHPDAVAAYLSSPVGREMPIANRLLATLALQPQAAAVSLASLLPEIGRPLDNEEVRTLAAQADVPEVAAALERLALDPASRAATLRALLSFRTSLLNPGIESVVTKAAAALFKEGADAALAIELAGGFKLRSLEPQVAKLVADPTGDLEQRRAAIRCLRELGAMSVGTMQTLLSATDADRRLRADTIAACAESREPAACAAFVAAWDDLAIGDRPAAAAGLARHREGATALLAAFDAEAIDPASLPISVLADMRLVLEGNRQLETIWSGLTADAPGVLRLTGDDAGAGSTVSLAGPFTVEAWVNLEAPIDNQDSLLAAAGVLDINFYGGQFRVWTGQHNDIVIAASRTIPDTWTHYAVTRDARGVFRVYIDGELDAESKICETTPYADLRLGWSTPSGGTQGRLAEFRVWNRARSADEIRAEFDRSYVGDDARPASLVSVHGGDSWGELGGDARVEPALDAPALVTADELITRAEKFARFRGLAAAGGNPDNGRHLFTSRCLTCHQQGGQGGKIGPVLDGVGATGVEAILRNVLTPNAAMEGGYRSFRVLTKDGRIVQGMLVSRDADAIVIRQPDTADIRIPTKDVARADFLPISLMPEGLLESMSAQEVSDLFAHLASLTGKPDDNVRLPMSPRPALE